MLDVNSGAVHVVDDIVYDLMKKVEGLLESGVAAESSALLAALSHMDKPNAADEEIAEALEEILYLKENELLYVPDIYEQYVKTGAPGARRLRITYAKEED